MFCAVTVETVGFVNLSILRKSVGKIHVQVSPACQDKQFNAVITGGGRVRFLKYRVAVKKH